MADPVKVLAQEITLGTSANDVSIATLDRIVNNTAGSALITQKYANGTTISTFTLGSNSSGFGDIFLIKQPTDTVQSNVASGVLAVSVGYY
jgi:hypothetical protein